MKRKLFIIIPLFLIIGLVTLWAVKMKRTDLSFLSPLSQLEEKDEGEDRPLDKYQFARLKENKPQPSQIKIEGQLGQSTGSTAYIFFYQSEGRKITGLINIPLGQPPIQGWPVIIMIRGYVDQKIYQTGLGTQRAAEVYANHGFVTLAPDFLGYGGSDQPPADIWEARFLRVVNVLDLLASVSSLDQSSLGNLRVNPQRIGLWGHSNGGMISLSLLAISGGDYPTVLWAPVSQYFPYDILYYAWEAEDRGKGLRKNLAEFEEKYDTESYSFDNFFEDIKAPVQLHQGTADPYIPLSWSDSLAQRLKSLGGQVVYYTYSGAGHHMEGVWEQVVARDLEFFNQLLQAD